MYDVAKMLLSAGAEVTWTVLFRYVVLARSNAAETSSEILKEIFLELLEIDLQRIPFLKEFLY